jgi:hypothetical protein
MLHIENDFSQFDRLDWSLMHEVGIRFLIELLAYTFGKKPEQIIYAICSHGDDLPRLRYEEIEIDDSDDPNWIRSRYFTVLHVKDLLSSTLETSTWERVPDNSVYCREDVKYRNSTCPIASGDEIIFEAATSTDEVRAHTRIITPGDRILLEDCWASRDEFEDYLANNPVFAGWLDALPKRLTPSDERAATNIKERPRWFWQKAGGKRWMCGPENNPMYIDEIKGCEDLHYAISREGEDCPHLEYLAEDEDQAEIARTLMYSESFDAVDETTNQAINEEIENLELELAAESESGNIEKAEEINDRLNKLRDYKNTNTMPSGKSRKMNEGDQSAKAAKAMRGRRDTLERELREAGLTDIANHISAKAGNFKIRSRTFAYNCGPPWPEWIT